MVDKKDGGGSSPRKVMAKTLQEKKGPVGTSLEVSAKTIPWDEGGLLADGLDKFHAKNVRVVVRDLPDNQIRALAVKRMVLSDSVIPEDHGLGEEAFAMRQEDRAKRVMFNDPSAAQPFAQSSNIGV